LITLAIIGVVVAITAPILKDYMAGSFIRQAQKSYVVVTKIIRGAENNAGPISTWPDRLASHEDFFKEFIEPQFQYVEKVSKTGGNVRLTESDYPNTLKRMCETFNSYNPPVQIYLLRDGSAVGFYSIQDNLTIVIFDTNGEGEPNRMGVDTFVMTLVNSSYTNHIILKDYEISYGLNPMGIELTEAEQIQNCKKTEGIDMYYKIPMSGTCLAVLINNGFKNSGYPITSWGK